MSEARRMFLAFALAAGVYFAWVTIYDYLYPPPPSPQTQPARPGAATNQPADTRADGGADDAALGTRPADGQAAGTGQAALEAAPGAADDGKPLGRFSFSGTKEPDQAILGGREQDDVRAVIVSKGGGVRELYLTERKESGQYLHREAVDSENPYQLLMPITTSVGTWASFETSTVTVVELDGTIERELGKWDLSGHNWEIAERLPDRVTLATTLRDPDGNDYLRLLKIYALAQDEPRIELTLSVENLADQPFTLRLKQDGPLGVQRENTQYDMRRLAYAVRADGVIEPAAYQRNSLSDEPKPIGSADNPPVWVALCNRYFAAYIRPLPDPRGAEIAFVDARAVHPKPPEGIGAPSDALAEFLTHPLRIIPGETRRVSFELYGGAKNYDQLKRVDPAYVDRSQIGYIAAADTDARCCCTFAWLTELMTWLLETIHVLVRNYGIAIFVLVLIIRALLHPLAVFQQKSMYRMQEVQLRLKPKMDALKEKYGNDRQAFTREQMKLWSDEGVNPAAGMVGMLPMIIQMPILIALWTALNTDVNLRHSALDPFWIEDLSVPDALIAFSQPIDIPVLSWLPFLGQMFTEVPSINLLPILMGISMYLQQRYMPKPGMEARREAAAKQKSEKKTTGSGPGGMDIEEQMKQQQLVAYMMSFMFPLLFYYMPAGLNLYWLSSNVVGIAESLRIKAELKREKDHRERFGPPQKKPSRIAEFFKRMAEQAEELQKQADHASGRDPKKKKKAEPDAEGGGKKRKK